MISIFAVALCILSVNGLSQSDGTEVDLRDERSVNSYIKNSIEDVRQYIRNLGLDPLLIGIYERNYSLPVPVIFNSGFSIKELTSTGMSNIVVNSVYYSIIASRLHFDFELPLIDFGLDSGSTETTVFGNTFKMNSSGKFSIKRMRFAGQIRINIGIGKPITIRSTKINFTMEGIESDVKLIIQDEDYSTQMNNFLNSTVPETFKEYKSEINELLEILVLDYGNQYLQFQQEK